MKMKKFWGNSKNYITFLIKVILGLIFLGLIACSIYCLIVRPYRYDKALYLISALIQSEVTLFAIIFSITMVISQIIVGHYGVPPLRIIIEHPKFKSIGIIFILAIVSGILSLLVTYNETLFVTVGTISIASAVIMLFELYPFTKAMISLVEVNGLFREIIRHFPNPITAYDMMQPQREQWFKPLKNLLDSLVEKNSFSDLYQLLKELNRIYQNMEIESFSYYHNVYINTLRLAVKKRSKECIDVILGSLLQLGKILSIKDRGKTETRDGKLKNVNKNIGNFRYLYGEIKEVVVQNLDDQFLVDRFFRYFTHELISEYGDTEVVRYVLQTLTDIIGSENLPHEFRKQAFEELTRPLKTFSFGFPTDDAIVVSVEIIRKIISLNEEILQNFQSQFCELEKVLYKDIIKQKIDPGEYNKFNNLVKNICKEKHRKSLVI